MILKIFKAIWFLSVLACLAVFLYVYASLQEEVVLREEGGRVLISREAWFYTTLAILTVFSALVFAIRKLYQDPAFLVWFHGLNICLNIFFIITLSFISLINSGEAFDYARIGTVIYGSVILFVLWSAAWPGYALFRRKV